MSRQLGGDRRSGGGHQNAVKGGRRRPAQAAIAGEHPHPGGETEHSQARSRRIGQFGVAFDRDHLAAHLGQDGGLIARAGSHFEHPHARDRGQQLAHAGHDVRLADGLTEGDGLRRIVIGHRLLRNKELARNGGHSRQDALVGDAMGAELSLHHLRS